MKITPMKAFSVVAMFALLVTLKISDTVAAPLPANSLNAIKPLEVFPDVVNLETSRDTQALVVRYVDKQGISTDVTTSAKSPPGQHKNLLCQVTIMKDGEPVIQNVGQGGILRIDRGAAPKETKNNTVASKDKEGGK